ncbi:hypothetical protein [Brumimicrobium salinarum]|uniref:hypothetical protein n=1 Tax=Brumimicrobium salinarum TaxID=2058658 RepID=UPI00196A9999|nr:hypothetical protein [Brumimicrobium salinarum]
MKTHKLYIASLLFAIGMTACTTNQENKAVEQKEEEHEHAHDEVHLSATKFNSLNIELDTLQRHTFEGIVYTNGSLEVPPQHEATVTAVLGGNVVSVEVIEGTDVKKMKSLLI